MDVSNPISSVIPSLDGPVYSALSSTNGPMTLGAVHRLTEGASKSGVRTVLLRMIASGLVDLVPGGYRLNREHLAAGPIEALASLYGELTKRIRAEVDSWQPKPLLVGLYGSAARRDGDEGSDIDLLIIGDVESLGDSALHLAHLIERWTGNRAQIVLKSPAEIGRLRRAKEPIVRNWEQDLTAISGTRSALAKAS
jgi:predicted nucleotidyltransferase